MKEGVYGLFKLLNISYKKIMVSNEYAVAYKEVLELLIYFPIEDVKKIPADVIQYLLNNKDENYKYYVDKNKTFEEQEKTEFTKAIFANFFRDYWATQYQKERIIQKEKLEKEEKRIKYNPDDIFRNKKISVFEDTNNSKLEVYKNKNIIRKIFDKILGLFKK